MNHLSKDGSLRRLKSIAGHVKGIEKMVADDAYCIDVIKQIQAVQAALNKVSIGILDGHLHTCLTTAVRGEDVGERERVLAEVAEVFEMATKV
jgi:CsoR family transcriptional regulator, copper-sensing transcriptional repressor